MKSCRGKRKDDSRLDGRRIARLRTLAAAIGVFGALALNAGATVTKLSRSVLARGCSQKKAAPGT